MRTPKLKVIQGGGKPPGIPRTFMLFGSKVHVDEAALPLMADCYHAWRELGGGGAEPEQHATLGDIADFLMLFIVSAAEAMEACGITYRSVEFDACVARRGEYDLWRHRALRNPLSTVREEVSDDALAMRAIGACVVIAHSVFLLNHLRPLSNAMPRSTDAQLLPFLMGAYAVIYHDAHALNLPEIEAARLRLSQSQRNRASRPHKDVTRAQLAKCRDEFEMENGHKKGWIKVACAKFGISADTVRKRMNE